MIFANRAEAGEILSWQLVEYAGRHDVVVLGIPRGGIPVAYEIAKEIKAPLDILVLRKLGVPGQEELGFGAVARGGIRILDSEIVLAMRIGAPEIERIAGEQRLEVERRESAYRGGMASLDVRGKIVIVVDDGIATGSSMRVAIVALRQMAPAGIVVAAPVAAYSAARRLETQVDAFICTQTPKVFNAIGEFYDDFSQVSDDEVKELLTRAASPAVNHRLGRPNGHA
jgi:putative phosphoribosyl transferase